MKHFTFINHTKYVCIALIAGISLFLEACAPSAEKIEEAQNKYAQLAKIHNTAVEVHKNISNPTLDASLSELSDQLALLNDFNLNEMKNEEIDTMIASMDRMIASYQKNIDTMEEIKAAEDAAVITPILLSLVNNTKFTFTSLSLYEEGSLDSHINILSGLAPLTVGQSITGLTIERNVNNTPWILSFETEDGKTFDVTLPVGEYSEKGMQFYITYNEKTEDSVVLTTEPST